ncbi:MAG: hypothetical protein QCI82_01505 [Candidatus Thermoplasmatota archaeon]|nr:hypothetical protein [Candidatus Thermoplasmatota archaeon]
MYVGMVTYHFSKDRLDDAIRIWKCYVLQDAEKQSGFVKGELFIDDETGKGFDMGFWETEEDARRYEEVGVYDLLIERMREFLVSPPVREKFRVVVG